MKTFYKEEIGFLVSGLFPDSGSWQYEPTGEGAHATLGLQDLSGNVDTYVETLGISGGGSVTINLYDSMFQTGMLPSISGITQTPLTETVEIPAIPTSGVYLGGNSELLKKDF